MRRRALTPQFMRSTRPNSPQHNCAKRTPPAVTVQLGTPDDGLHVTENRLMLGLNRLELSLLALETVTIEL
jgi:hypothetical protein